MKKIILISVVDYLAAGGKITKGDYIYRKGDISPVNPEEWSKLLENSLFMGSLLSAEKTEQGTYLISNSSYKSLPMIPELMFVKVEVTIEPASLIN